MRIHPAERGLTLIEVLMGVVILGTAIAPVAMLLSGGLQGSAGRTDDARALYLAQGRMEEMLALDYDDLAMGAPSSLSDWVAVPDSVYRRVDIQLNPEDRFDPNMKRIIVTVGSVRLAMYKTRPFEP